MIAIAADHGGYEMKEQIMKYLDQKGVAYKNFGTDSAESVDYPDYASYVCKAILSGECDKGILICGTGVGIGIAANKYDGIRCGICSESFSAKMCRVHNNANVIAFGGRVMDDSKPKYKNSSDTPVFKKSRNLFALNFARHNCQESLILCEGYMDVIAMHAAGFENAVATLGTAITSEQARMMSRYTKKVIISYDADEAGQKAAMRAVKMLTDVGLDVSILKVPGAKDPDEYIKKFGADKFRNLLSESKSKFDYNLEIILSKYDINLSQDKIKALHESEKLICETYSSAERDIYIQNVSKIFGVDAKSVKADVNSLLSKAEKAWRKDESNKIKQDAVGYSDRVNPDFIKAPAAAKCEENLLGLLLMYPEHRKAVFEGNLLTSDDFFTELNKRIFTYLENAYHNNGDSHLDIDEQFTVDERGRITRMKLSRMELSDNGAVVLNDAIDKLRRAVEKKKNEKNDSFESLNKILELKRKKITFS